MTETLLSPSNVLLFGRVMGDIAITIPRIDAVPNVTVVAISRDNIDLPNYKGIDGVAPRKNQRVLLSAQDNPEEIGIYIVKRREELGITTYVLDATDIELYDDMVIHARRGPNKGIWKLSFDGADNHKFEKVSKGVPLETHDPFRGDRKGGNRLLEEQITEGVAPNQRQACFARIYGFTYEGTYYDLHRPMLFLVHGKGEPASEARTGLKGRRKPSRAPGDPSLTGLVAAEFEFADDVRVWSYDKADYTIRMDVETGMFEQVLLDAFFSGGGASGAMVSGAMVSGAMVGGPSARGAMVRGAMVSGAMLRGRRGGRGDPSD